MNPIYASDEQQLDFIGIGMEILRVARNELYLNMRFLDNALAQLYPAGDMEMSPAGSDGDLFYYQPEKLMAMFKKSREQVNRLYLHTLFHCIFCHIYPDNKVDQEYWNLACDVVVEEIIDGLYVKCVHRPVTMVRRQAEALPSSQDHADHLSFHIYPKGSPFRGRFPLSGGNVPKGQKG